MEHKVTEQWQPRKVKKNKISKGFPYLVATNLAVPLHATDPTIESKLTMPQSTIPSLLPKAHD